MLGAIDFSELGYGPLLSSIVSRSSFFSSMATVVWSVQMAMIVMMIMMIMIDDHDDHLGNSNMVSADDDDDQNPPPHDHHGDHLQVRAIGSHYEKLAQVSVL